MIATAAVPPRLLGELRRCAILADFLDSSGQVVHESVSVASWLRDPWLTLAHDGYSFIMDSVRVVVTLRIQRELLLAEVSRIRFYLPEEHPFYSLLDGYEVLVAQGSLLDGLPVAQGQWARVEVELSLDLPRTLLEHFA